MGELRADLMRRAAIAALLVAAVALLSRTATADDVVPAGFYKTLTDKTVETRRTAFGQINQPGLPPNQASDAMQKVKAATRAYTPAIRTPSLTSSDASAAVSAAQAAIQTSVTGAQGGVSVSPLTLLGYGASAHQLVATLAALKNNDARYQLAYNYQPTSVPLDPIALQMAPCAFTSDVEVDIRSLMAPLQGPHEHMCEQVKSLLTKPGRTRGATSSDEYAAAACGFPSSRPPDDPASSYAPSAFADVVGLFTAEAKRLAGLADGIDHTDEIVLLRAIAATDDAAKLTALKDKWKTPDYCQSVDAITAAATTVAWNTSVHRVGISFRTDAYQQTFGLNTSSSTPLATGWAEAEIRGTYTFIRGPTEVDVGMGYGRSREQVGETAWPYVSPSLSVAWTFASLTGQSLYDRNGNLRLASGELPPRMSAGIDAQIRYSLSIPTTQTTNWQQVMVTPYLDFIFNSTLGFQLGFPVQGQVAIRQANTKSKPPVTEERALQWTLPLFVTSVLKM